MISRLPLHAEIGKLVSGEQGVWLVGAKDPFTGAEQLNRKVISPDRGEASRQIIKQPPVRFVE